VLVANVDNVARPLIYRRISRVHPMITLVGAFAGVRYFGVLGVLFGPLGLAYFFELLAIYRRESPGAEQLPIQAITRPSPHLDGALAPTVPESLE
jgi:predicted PurR-regulated permease PerM